MALVPVTPGVYARSWLHILHLEEGRQRATREQWPTSARRSTADKFYNTNFVSAKNFSDSVPVGVSGRGLRHVNPDPVGPP